MIQVQIDNPIGNALGKNHIGVFLQIGYVGGWHKIDHINVAGQKRCDACRIFLDRFEHHFIELGHVAPIGGVLCDQDARHCRQRWS